MEFAEGNFGEIQAALEYHNDVTAPVTAIEYSSAQTSGDPINFKFNWVGEAVGHLLHDGRHDAGQKVADCATRRPARASATTARARAVRARS